MVDTGADSLLKNLWEEDKEEEDAPADALVTAPAEIDKKKPTSDEILKDLWNAEPEESQIITNLDAAAKTTPSGYAKIQKMGAKVGLPPSVVQSDFGAVKAIELRQRAEKLLSGGSEDLKRIMSKALSKADFAALSQDDLQTYHQMVALYGMAQVLGKKEWEDQGFWEKHLINPAVGKYWQLMHGKNISEADRGAATLVGMDMIDAADNIADKMRIAYGKKPGETWAAFRQTESPALRRYAMATDDKTRQAIRAQYSKWAVQDVSEAEAAGKVAASFPKDQEWEKILATKDNEKVIMAILDKPERFFRLVVEMSVTSAPSLAIMFATKNPMTAAVSSMWMEQGFTIMEEMQSRGINIKDSKAVVAALKNRPMMEKIRAAAIRKGVGVAAFDMLGFLAAGVRMAPRLLFGKPISVTAQTAAGLVPQTVFQAISETSGEVLGQKMQKFAPIGGSGEPIDWTEAMLEGIGAAGTVFQDAGLLGGGRVLREVRVANAKKRLFKQERDRINRIKTVIESIAEKATGSEMASVAPETLVEFVESVQEETGIDTVYIDPKGLEEYFQRSDVDRDEAFDLLGVNEDQFNQAQEFGGYVEIPLSKWVTQEGLEEHREALSPHTKFFRDHQTEKELDVLQSEGEVDPLISFARGQRKDRLDFDRLRETEAQGSMIRRDIVKQLIEAGVAPREAETSAAIWENTFLTQAKRFGFPSAWELYKSMRPTISRQLAQRQRTDSQADIILNRLREGKKGVTGLSKTPALDILRNAGVRPGSTLAGELKNLGINTKSFERPDGVGDLDNFVGDDHPFFEGLPDSVVPVEEPGGGYIRPEAFYAALGDEQRGNPVRSEEERTAEEEFFGPMEEISDIMRELDLDIGTMTNEEIKESIREAHDKGTIERFQSAAPLIGRPMRITGTGPNGRILNWDVAEAFTERHMDRYDRTLDPNDPADYEIIVRELNDEYQLQIQQEETGSGWYVEDIATAVELTKMIIPELSEPQNRDLFLTIAALLSPQQKPAQNWDNAIVAMQGYLKDGRIATRKPTGKQFGVDSHTTGLLLLQHLIDRHELEGALEWVMTPHTGAEIAEVRRESGLFKEKRLLSGYVASETNLKGEYLGIYMMGPKVGDFMMNATGFDQQAVTVDLWLARTYNRMLGRLLDVNEQKRREKKIVADVRTPAEREMIKRIIRDLAEKNGVEPSAMQAALWYFEQRLYRNHGVEAGSENFSGAAQAAAEKRSILIPGTVVDVFGAGEAAEATSLEDPYLTRSAFVEEYFQLKGFHSRVASNIREYAADKATAEQWKAQMKKGSRAEAELGWIIGLDDFLKSAGANTRGKTIDRDILLEFVEGNGIVLSEVVLGTTAMFEFGSVDRYVQEISIQESQWNTIRGRLDRVEERISNLNATLDARYRMWENVPEFDPQHRQEFAEKWDEINAPLRDPMGETWTQELPTLPSSREGFASISNYKSWDELKAEFLRDQNEIEGKLSTWRQFKNELHERRQITTARLERLTEQMEALGLGRGTGEYAAAPAFAGGGAVTSGGDNHREFYITIPRTEEGHLEGAETRHVNLDEDIVIKEWTRKELADLEVDDKYYLGSLREMERTWNTGTMLSINTLFVSRLNGAETESVWTAERTSTGEVLTWNIVSEENTMRRAKEIVQEESIVRDNLFSHQIGRDASSFFKDRRRQMAKYFYMTSEEYGMGGYRASTDGRTLAQRERDERGAEEELTYQIVDIDGEVVGGPYVDRQTAEILLTQMEDEDRDTETLNTEYTIEEVPGDLEGHLDALVEREGMPSREDIQWMDQFSERWVEINAALEDESTPDESRREMFSVREAEPQSRIRRVEHSRNVAREALGLGTYRGQEFFTAGTLSQRGEWSGARSWDNKEPRNTVFEVKSPEGEILGSHEHDPRQAEAQARARGRPVSPANTLVQDWLVGEGHRTGVHEADTRLVVRIRVNDRKHFAEEPVTEEDIEVTKMSKEEFLALPETDYRPLSVPGFFDNVPESVDTVWIGRNKRTGKPYSFNIVGSEMAMREAHAAAIGPMPWPGRIGGLERPFGSEGRTREQMAVKKTLYIDEVQPERQAKAREVGWSTREDVERAISITPEEERAGHELPPVISGDHYDPGLVPIMPYKTTNEWVTLALQRMITAAVSEGYTSVAWTSGEIQVDRYNLARHMEAVGYDPVAKKLYYIPMDSRLSLSDANQSDWETVDDPVEENQLADYVGRQAAEDLLSREVDTWYPDRENPITMKVLGNDDLDNLVMEDAGLKKLYNKQMVNNANKLGKKYKVRAQLIDPPFNVGQNERTRISFERWLFETPAYRHLHIGDIAFADDDATQARNDRIREEYDEYISGAGEGSERDRVWNFEITPEMARDVSDKGFFLQDSEKDKTPPKGSFEIGIADRSKRFINLFQSADRSTFLHESGHFFLEMMRDLDMGDQVPAEYRRDVKTLFQWFGVNSWNEITGEHHEQFAAGFETYLMQGRAPSRDLLDVFRTFKDWLVDVYRSASGRVKPPGSITPEIKAVFDRLIASEEEIEASKELNEYMPMIGSEELAAELGMTRAEYVRYVRQQEKEEETAKEKIMAELAKDIAKERKEKHAEAKERVTADVTEDMNASPLWRVLTYLRKGEFLHDEDISEDITTAKLNRSMVVEMFGEGILTTLPGGKGKTGLTSNDVTALNPEIVADFFGFQSGEEMIQAILDSAVVQVDKHGQWKSKYLTLAQTIKEEVNRRLEAEGAAPLDPDQTRQAAVDAYHNMDRGELLSMELAVLRRHVSDQDQAGLRRGAERRVAQEGAGTVEDRTADIADTEEGLAIADEDTDIQGARQARARLAGAEARGEAARPIRAAERVARSQALQAVRISTTEARSIARSHIDNLKVNDLDRLSKYAQDERRAGRNADKALREKNWSQAAEFKWQQMVNHFIYLEGQKALKRRTSAFNLFKRFSVSNKNKKSIDKEYLVKIQTLLAAYEAGPGRMDAETSRAALSGIGDWVTNQNNIEGDQAQIVIDPEVFTSATRPVGDISMVELESLRKAIMSLSHNGNKRSRDTKRQEKEAALEIADSIYANNKLLKPRPEFTSARTKAKDLSVGFFGLLRKIEAFARELDGMQDGGPVWTALWKPIADAQKSEILMRKKAMKRVKEILAKQGKKSRWWTRRHKVAGGPAMTKVEILGLALNMGNTGNREAIINGGRGYMQSEEVVNEYLSKLDNNDWDFVQAVWDHVNEYWTEIAALEERMTGVAPEKIPADEFTTPGGRIMRGGYFPIKFDPTRSAKSHADAITDLSKDLMAGTHSRAATKHGFTEARVGSKDKPVLLSVDAYFQHLDSVIHDLSHREAIHQVSKLLNNNDFREAVQYTKGLSYLRHMDGWLRNVAAGRTEPMNSLEKGVKHARLGVSIAEMGFSFRTALLQPLGLTQSIVSLGELSILGGIKDFYSSPNEWGQFIFEKSPMMSDRANTFDRDIGDQLNKMKPGAYMDKFRSAAFWMIGTLDLTVSLPTWLAAYHKHLNETGATEEGAIAYADSVVRLSQGSGSALDLAQIQAGGEYQKMFTAFYTFFSAYHNMVVDSFKRYGKKPPSIGATLKLSKDLLWLAVIPSLISAYVLDGKFDDEDDDDKPWPQEAAEVILDYGFSGIVLFRDLMKGLVTDYGVGGPTLVKVLSSAAGGLELLGKAAYKATAPIMPWDSDDVDITRADYRNAIMAVGYLLHLPSRQSWRSLDYTAQYLDGEFDEFEPFKMFVTGVPYRK